MTQDVRGTVAAFLIALSGTAATGPARAQGVSEADAPAQPKAATPVGDSSVPASGPPPAAANEPIDPSCPCHEHDGEQQPAGSSGGTDAANTAGTPTTHGAAGTPTTRGAADAADTAGAPGTRDMPDRACPHHGEGPCPCQQADADEGHAGLGQRPPTGEPHNAPPQVLILTLGPAALGTFEASNTWRAGGVLMIAVPVAHHELELQVNLGFFGGPAGLASGLDFLVKRPFRMGDAWRPYIGIGPSLSLERLNTEPRDVSTSTFGVSGTGGTYYWFTGECAVMAYAEYTAVFSKRFRNALQLGIGVSYALDSEPQ